MKKLVTIYTIIDQGKKKDYTFTFSMGFTHNTWNEVKDRFELYWNEVVRKK
uniref:Uncharacterized protein n=1 Tax=viral metagenome TaxID=1070528 RepID=A0A6M3KCQ5_9ZZZZ